MDYSKDKLLELGLEKLRNFGFENVSKKNVFEDEVYKYHLKIFMNSLKGQNDILDITIKELVSTIDKTRNETN